MAADDGAPRDPLFRQSRALRQLADASMQIVQRTPVASHAGSQRRAEEERLRGLPRPGGRLRSAALDELASTVRVSLVAVIGHLDGLAAIVEAAERTHPLAHHSASAVVRAQLEVAGGPHWLLDPQCSPIERLQRWLIWKLDDASSLMASTDGYRHLTEQEREELSAVAGRWVEKVGELAEGCGWSIRSGRHPGLFDDPPGPKPKLIPLPRGAALVDDLVGGGNYEMLSYAAHGTSWVALAGIEDRRGVEPGQVEAKVTPFGLDLPMLVGLSVQGTYAVVRRYAEWNGLPRRDLEWLSRHQLRAQRAASLSGWGPG